MYLFIYCKVHKTFKEQAGIDSFTTSTLLCAALKEHGSFYNKWSKKQDTVGYRFRLYNVISFCGFLQHCCLQFSF